MKGFIVNNVTTRPRLHRGSQTQVAGRLQSLELVAASQAAEMAELALPVPARRKRKKQTEVETWSLVQACSKKNLVLPTDLAIWLEEAKRFDQPKYVYNDIFETGVEDLISQILADPPAPLTSRTIKPPPGLPTYLNALYEVPLLSRQEEQQLFRKMNYCLYQCDLRCGDMIKLKRVKIKAMKTVLEHWAQATTVKHRLIRSNLRLVVNLAKKMVAKNLNHGKITDLFDEISTGNASLLNAVAGFDFAKGNKFSTYATWCIRRNRDRSQGAQERREFSGAEMDLRPDHRHGSAARDERRQQQYCQLVATLLADEKLDPRSRAILVSRFGLLGVGAKPKTLEKVGSELGITKERTRQLEEEALKTLRLIAVRLGIDLGNVI